jgi:hypothetical protein
VVGLGTSMFKGTFRLDIWIDKGTASPVIQGPFNTPSMRPKPPVVIIEEPKKNKTVLINTTSKTNSTTLPVNKTKVSNATKIVNVTYPAKKVEKPFIIV